MVHTYNTSTREARARELKVQGHPQLDLEFEVSLGYIVLCLKKHTWKFHKYLSVKQYTFGKSRSN